MTGKKNDLVWHKVLSKDELPEGRVTSVSCKNRTLCMSRYKGEYGALDNKVDSVFKSFRGALNRARRLAGLGSLIPGNRNYRQQMRIYEGNTCRAGLSKMHGLRHACAQNRYEELTGW